MALNLEKQLLFVRSCFLAEKKKSSLERKERGDYMMADLCEGVGVCVVV